MTSSITLVVLKTIDKFDLVSVNQITFRYGTNTSLIYLGTLNFKQTTRASAQNQSEVSQQLATICKRLCIQ